MTTILIQVVLVVTLFSEDAFNFALDLTSALTLIPFLLAAGYALKLASPARPTTSDPQGWRARADRRRAGHALHRVPAVRGRTEVHAASRSSSTRPATILFVMARREQGRRLFSPRELVILAVSVVGAVIGVVALATGWISI